MNLQATTIQIPAPPAPPEFVHVVGGGGASPAEAIMLVAVSVVAVFVLFTIVAPLVRALARRIEGKGSVPTEQLEQMNDRLLEMDEMRMRLTELEERVDFAERLLAQHPTPIPLARGEDAK